MATTAQTDRTSSATVAQRTPSTRSKSDLLALAWDHPLLCILIAAALVRLAFMLIIPHGEAPDEPHHLWVIQFVRDHMRLTTPVDVKAGGVYAVYGAMPALGYLPQILVSKLFPADHIIFFARCGSLLAGLATVWIGFLAGKEIFGVNTPLARALPWLMVFHPQLAFLHSYSNNDSAAVALSSLIIYMVIVNLKHGPTLKRCLVLGGASGLIVLCKFNGLVMLPVVVLSVAAAAWLHQTSVAFCLACLYLVGISAVAACGWWFMRNYQMYGMDDILGVKSGYNIYAQAFHQPMDYRRPIFAVLADKRWWRFLFFSFWGIFGHMTRWLWRPLYFVYIGFAVACVIGWLKARFHSVPNLVASWQQQQGVGIQRRMKLVTPAIWLMLGLCFLLNFVAVAWSQLGGAQGRYLFISEIPILVLLLEGLSRLGPRAGRWAVGGFLVFNIIVCLGVWIMLFRIYGLSAHLP